MLVRRRPAPRLLIAAAAYLWAGAVVTVAIAWGCAALGPSEVRSEIIDERRIEAAELDRFAGMTRHLGVDWRTWTDTLSGRYLQLLTRKSPGCTHWWVQGIETLSWSTDDVFVVRRRRYGWPFRALHCDSANHWKTKEYKAPAPAWDLTIWPGIDDRWARSPLPLRPEPFNFTANTLVHAATLYLLVAGLRRARREIARRSACPNCGYCRHCPACGYSRAGLTGGAACPECGAEDKNLPSAGA